jgi:LysM repeat protein
VRDDAVAPFRCQDVKATPANPSIDTPVAFLYCRAMTFSVSYVCTGLMLLAGLALSGCGPYAQSRVDEEKEPHFMAGKRCVSAMDYKGAIEEFEKALRVNPQSASAHFELAGVLERKELADPAAAIYHYEQYLKLRTDADQADLAKGRVLSCKQELARTVYLGPLTDKVQHQLEQLAEENKRLTEDNKRLRDDLDKWTAYASRLQTLTNRGSLLPPPVARGGQPPVPGPPGPTLTTASNSTNRAVPPVTTGTRTHKVKAGETPSGIAAQYGIKLDALMAANPKLEARRMQPGQVLNIPSPP